MFKSKPNVSKFLKGGAIGVLPTDTVYGLVARASDQEAVNRLYKLKNREHNPGTIIAANIEQLVELGLKRRYLKAVEQYWPGPVSVIIPCGEELTYLHRGYNGLAIRLPKDKELARLLSEVGPLLTTSANLAGQPVSNTLTEARAYFVDQVDFYVDGGDLTDHLASTIIKIVDDAVEVIRAGAVEIKQ